MGVSPDAAAAAERLSSPWPLLALPVGVELGLGLPGPPNPDATAGPGVRAVAEEGLVAVAAAPQAMTPSNIRLPNSMAPWLPSLLTTPVVLFPMTHQAGRALKTACTWDAPPTRMGSTKATGSPLTPPAVF